MSNIYFMCDNCGIETNGFTFVNGMKFCAKCYHQIFGKDNQQAEITQLKQQLAEKEEELLKQKEKSARTEQIYNGIIVDKDKEIEKLKLKLDIRAMSLQNINTERIESERNQTQLAIQELEKVKVNLKDRITMMSNEEHSYLQKVVIWYDICNQVNKQIKELKGEKDEKGI